MMMQTMSCILATLVSGGIGTILLFMTRSYLRIASEDGDPPSENSDSKTRSSTTRFLLLSAALLTFVCAASATFMRLYYGEDLWIVWNCLLLCPVLWCCAYADKKAMLIPNKLLISGAVLRLILLAAMVFFHPANVLVELISSVIASIVLLLASLICRLVSRGAVGFGDVKLLTMMGFSLGLGRIWGSILISMICGFFYAGYLLITKRATGKTEIAFAPVLLIGTVLSFFLTGS